MARGRPPKPIEQHRADGTFRKDRHAPAVVLFPGQDDAAPAARVKLKPPKSLKGAALEWWKEHVPGLEQLGMLQQIDVSVLEMLAETYAIWKDALKALKKYPMLRENQIAERDAKLSYHKLAVEFGFTPTSRARLKVDTTKPEKGVAARKRGVS
jgi:P27 family predicted phage terminase small subunit